MRPAPENQARTFGRGIAGNCCRAPSSGHPVGSDVHVYIDKNPAVEPSGNWWAVTLQINRHIVGDVNECPEFCR